MVLNRYAVLARAGGGGEGCGAFFPRATLDFLVSPRLSSFTSFEVFEWGVLIMA